MPRGVEREWHVTQGQPRRASHTSQPDALDKPMAKIHKMMQKRKVNVPKTTQAVFEVNGQNKQASGSLDLKTMLEKRLAEVKRKRQQAALEKQLLEVGSKEASVNTPASCISSTQQLLDLDLDDQPGSAVGDAGLGKGYGAKGSLYRNGDVHHFTDPDDGLDYNVDGIIIHNIEHAVLENASEQGGQHEHSRVDQDHQSVQTVTIHPSMTPQEKTWYAMSFEELYQHARSKNFGKTGKESRKSGRIRVIKWLCEKEDITPYVAPSITPVIEATPVTTRPVFRPTGAISHPEAVLRTSDPALQRLIDEREKKYREWPAADLLALAMKRSYRLLKDSQDKLPSKSISAMANWLAGFDVLKSPREKRWWLGDGIDLVNKAKAMGYQGPSSKKYDVIVWLRSTPDDCDVEVTEVAEPTPNITPAKRKAEDAAHPVSKRPAKGSKRPHGWGVLKHTIAFSLEYEYIFGPSLLVGPVTEENYTSVEVYFPKDIFYDWYAHAPLQWQGANILFENLAWEDIPLHYRGVFIVPQRVNGAITTTNLRIEDFEIVVALGSDGTASGQIYVGDRVSIVPRTEANARIISLGDTPHGFSVDGLNVGGWIHDANTGELVVPVGKSLTKDFSVSINNLVGDRNHNR